MVYYERQSLSNQVTAELRSGLRASIPTDTTLSHGSSGHRELTARHRSAANNTSAAISYEPVRSSPAAVSYERQSLSNQVTAELRSGLRASTPTDTALSHGSAGHRELTARHRSAVNNTSAAISYEPVRSNPAAASYERQPLSNQVTAELRSGLRASTSTDTNLSHGSAGHWSPSARRSSAANITSAVSYEPVRSSPTADSYDLHRSPYSSVSEELQRVQLQSASASTFNNAASSSSQSEPVSVSTSRNINQNPVHTYDCYNRNYASGSLERQLSPFSSTERLHVALGRNTQTLSNNPHSNCHAASGSNNPSPLEGFDPVKSNRATGSNGKQLSPHAREVSEATHEAGTNASNKNKPSPNSSSESGHKFNAARNYSAVNRHWAGRSKPSAPEHSARHRSKSRSRSNRNDNELNCPTCRTMFGLQIYQCSSGHSSCNSCKEYRRSCGICGNDIGTMRNIALEAYIAEKQVPCPNKSDGCMLIMKMAKIEFHVKECPFEEMRCPLQCDWKGKLRQLSPHFDMLHPEQRSVNVDKEIRLKNISSHSHNIYLVLLGTFHFLFHVKVFDRKIYMAAQLIGTQISASKWFYEIHVYSKNEYRRKYTFSDVCSSFREPVVDIFKKSKCSVLPFALASTFVHNNALTYKIYIKKNEDGYCGGDFNNRKGSGRA